MKNFKKTLLIAALFSIVASAHAETSDMSDEWWTIATVNVHMVNESNQVVFWGFSAVDDRLNDQPIFDNTHYYDQADVKAGPTNTSGVITPVAPGAAYQSTFIHFSVGYYQHNGNGNNTGHAAPHFAMTYSWKGGTREFDFFGEENPDNDDVPGLSVFEHDTIATGNISQTPEDSPSAMSGSSSAGNLVTCWSAPGRNTLDDSHNEGNMKPGAAYRAPGSTTFTIIFKDPGQSC